MFKYTNFSTLWNIVKTLTNGPQNSSDEIKTNENQINIDSTNSNYNDSNDDSLINKLPVEETKIIHENHIDIHSTDCNESNDYFLNSKLLVKEMPKSDKETLREAKIFLKEWKF